MLKIYLIPVGGPVTSVNTFLKKCRRFYLGRPTRQVVSAGHLARLPDSVNALLSTDQALLTKSGRKRDAITGQQQQKLGLAAKRLFWNELYYIKGPAAGGVPVRGQLTSSAHLGDSLSRVAG
jgi:hypothetical protein